MAIPGDILNRYVTPEQDFGGLYNLSDKIEKRRFREEQRAEREGARSAATGKFLADYLDPKDFLTGTYYDPQIVQGLNDLLVEGAELSRKGADPNILMMALAPKVNRLSQYSTKAKLIKKQKDEAVALLKSDASIDINKFNEYFDEEAFFDVDEMGNKKLKDPLDIDPEISYSEKVLNNRPVFTSAGFDELYKEANKAPVVRTEDIYRYSPKGGLSRTKAELKYENYLVPDVDSKGVTTGFVPKYEIATDEGRELIHSFRKDDKTEVEAPVRLLANDIFQRLPKKAVGYVRQEAIKAIKEYEKETGEKVQLNSTKGENLMRAIAYDELNVPTRKSGDIKNIDIVKPDQIRNVTNINMPGSGSTINDIYSNIEKATEDPTAAIMSGGVRIGTRMNALSGDEQKVIFDQFGGRKEDFNETTTFIHKGSDGIMKLYRVNDEGQPEVKPVYEVGAIKKVGTNLKAQPGIAEKREVIDKGEGNKNDKGGEISLNDVPVGTKLEKKGNDYYYKGKKVKM